MATSQHQKPSGPDSAQRENIPAPGVPFFTPLQSPPAGTARVPEGKTLADLPKVFHPLRIRGLLLQNRITLAPLCQYSADNGHMTPWHLAHLGGIIARGPGLACIEATAVTPAGRISPQDTGIWDDAHVPGLQRVVEFAHSQGQRIMIQLAHAGRKASTVAPWLPGRAAGRELGGWPEEIVGPSAVRWDEEHHEPRAMTPGDIEDFKAAFAAAVERSITAGFDAVEIHSAHGYLLHSFLSPVANHRTDQYGGSFENRIRLLLEVVKQTREQIPDSMPLFVRVSGTDALEAEVGLDSWTGDDTARLAPLLADAGCDVLDVSSGGMHPKQKLTMGDAYQAELAKQAKAAVGDRMMVSTVGGIRTGEIAEAQLQAGLDLVTVGRWFTKDPSLVWTWAEQLGVQVRLPNQIRPGFHGRAFADARYTIDEFM